MDEFWHKFCYEAIDRFVKLLPRLHHKSRKYFIHQLPNSVRDGPYKQQLPQRGITLEIVMQSIFSSEHSLSPAAILRQTMSVSVSEDGTPMVSFAVNRGKGSGSQTMPVSEFADYVSALEDALSNGISEESEDNLSAADMLRKTIQQGNGIVSFRVRGG